MGDAVAERRRAWGAAGTTWPLTVGRIEPEAEPPRWCVVVGIAAGFVVHRTVGARR